MRKIQLTGHIDTIASFLKIKCCARKGEFNLGRNFWNIYKKMECESYLKMAKDRAKQFC